MGWREEGSLDVGVTEKGARNLAKEGDLVSKEGKEEGRN